MPEQPVSKPLIKNISLPEADDIFLQMKEKDYRGRQLFNWLYEKNVDSFSEMTNFSKDLRQELDSKFSVSPLELEKRLISKIDGTEKYLFRTFDNLYIESVIIRNEDRITLCISSQIGCAMGCEFCQTAKSGFTRNLETGEILDQICQTRRISGLMNNNIVFMGMGEPFLNYDNVLRAADIMNYSFGFHISARKITLSTCGIITGIERFIDERRPYNLAISINDTESEKRKKNMPVEKKYPIAEIAKMLEKKFPASRNRLTLEYIMRKDNISTDDAKRLKKMFRFNRIKLNLIPLNPGSHSLEAPGEKDVDKFIKDLDIMNVPVSIRKSMGSDIDGACGQLSGKFLKDV